MFLRWQKLISEKGLITRGRHFEALFKLIVIPDRQKIVKCKTWAIDTWDGHGEDGVGKATRYDKKKFVALWVIAQELTSVYIHNADHLITSGHT
ncbi:hypothetical protein AJ87_48900 [Rhizobium yanglingense]|nr:hypothetical protein AJ87_48900 [Rhizobium yanglingense]